MSVPLPNSPHGGTTERPERSSLFNAFDDYFKRIPDVGAKVPTSAIKLPAQTIIIGEKKSGTGTFWMDAYKFDDIVSYEPTRHITVAGSPEEGGSNYMFADGSVRFLNHQNSFNLWLIDDLWRYPFPPNLQQ